MARLGIFTAIACSLLCNLASAQDKPDSPTLKSELHPDVARLIDTWLDAEQAYKKLPSMVARAGRRRHPILSTASARSPSCSRPSP